MNEEMSELGQFQNFENQQEHSKKSMRQYAWLLDYSYDERIPDAFTDMDDVIDLGFLKKEEKTEQTNIPLFKGDDECYITHTKKEDDRGVSLFEGINIPKSIVDLENPLKTSNARDLRAFNNPGFRRKELYWEQKKDHFVCEAGSSKVNHNQHIIEHLDKLLKCYTNDRDKGRMIAYRRAISFLKSLPFEVKSADDIKDMPTIGDKIKRKIVEIIQTGRLKKVETLGANPKNQTQEVFTQVWGVGPQTAAMFFFKGLRTLDDLRKNDHLLNRNQKIGLRYVHEFKQRIPREECTTIVQIVTETLQRLSGNQYEAIACGSYRRGKQDCGDIDILITRKDGKHNPGFLLELINEQTQRIILRLEKCLLTDHLTLPHTKKLFNFPKNSTINFIYRDNEDTSSHGSESYMGVGQLRKDLPHRRIDIKYYPREQFGYAVLYFTGSDHFNRSMRLFAQKKGYSLSDHGLYPVLRAAHNTKVWQGELIPCYTEEEVFKVLNISYKKPEDRSL